MMMVLVYKKADPPPAPRAGVERTAISIIAAGRSPIYTKTYKHFPAR
jgi:hypothetical protein